MSFGDGFGPVGPGQTGSPGSPGATGAAATITLGNVVTGDPGTEVLITNTGTSSAAEFNFAIPRGNTGTAGAAGPTWILDPIPAIIANSLASRSTSGAFTVGCIFSVTENATISWVEHYLIIPSTPETYNAAIWNSSGTQIATVAVSVNATGRTRFTFASPVALTAGVKYTCGFWNSTNNAYIRQIGLSTHFPTTTTAPISFGNRILVFSTGVYGSGNNTRPTTTESDQMPYLGGLTVP